MVNGLENTVFIASLIYASLIGKKSIIFYDSHYGSHRFKGAFARKIRFLILNLANFVVTAGPSSTKAVVTSGIKAHKVIELFNTVDVLKFYESTSDLRQEDLSKHRYLYVGQFITRKNVLNLIIAFSKIKGPQDVLKIVGTGELKLQMEKLIEDLNLSNSVFILGYKSPEEVLKIYAESDTLVLPSTEEVWGLVANEALASGLHLVISRQCGATETIENMKGVYVCETGAESIAKNMKQSCLEFKGRINDPEIMQFTPEKFAKKLSELIFSMENRSSRDGLVWISNVAMPYRIALWDNLSKVINLKVVCLSENDRIRKQEIKDTGRIYLSNLKLNSPFSLFGNDVYLNVSKLRKVLKNQIESNVYFDGFFSPTFLYGILYSRYKKKNIIIGYRSNYGSHRFKGAFARKIRFLILNLANFVVTAGPSSTKAVVTSGIKAHKVIELFNTVDVLKFYESTSDLRQEDLSKHRYLYVGQFITRKNVLNLIIAFSKIKGPQDVLKIVGTGELKLQMEKLIEDLNLSNSVFILGYKSPEEVLKIYAESDTLVLPSTEEVWGLVANEALASGLHLVISRQCGATETIENMKGVYVCETGAESIAKNMKQSCLEFKGRINDPEIMQFTPEKFAKKLSELIFSMENRSSRDGLD